MKQCVKKPGGRAQLEKAGWVRRTTYDEPRLSELVETYREMGLEVRLEEPGPDDSDECSACFGKSAGRLQTIYTREKAADGKKGFWKRTKAQTG